MGYSLEELGCVEHKSVCRCGGHSKDHDVVFQYWPDPQYGDEFTINTGLNHYLPWYKRLLVAIRYVLGIDNTFYAYVESTLDKQEVQKLHTYLSNVVKTFDDQPHGEAK